MRLGRSRFVCALVMVLGAIISPAAAQAAGSAAPRLPATQLHLALGDSVAAGVGASEPDATGYVPRVYDRLRDDLDCWPRPAPRCRSLHLANLAVGGATTASLIDAQLPVAIELLAERNADRHANDDVQVVTVTIGGNDVFGPSVDVCTTDPTAPACATIIAAQLQRVATNLPAILAALVDAAGADATVAVMTYYNPLEACVLSDFVGLADVVLEGGALGNGVVLPVGLNDIIRRSAADTGAVVADTFGALGTDDLVGGQDCLHPDDSGHQVIASLFADVILSR